MESRRTLLRGIGMATVAAATPSLFAGDRVGDVSEIDRQFSKAVANGALGAFAGVFRDKAEIGQLRVASHAWRVTRDHFDEIGLLAAGNDLVRTADLNVVMAELQKMPDEIVRIAQRHGVKVEVEGLQARIASLTPDRIAEAITFLETNGPAALFDQVSQALDDVINHRKPGRPGEWRVTSTSEGFCQGLAAIEAALWILAGMYTVGCAVTGGACVPCCVAAGVLGIAAGAVSLLEVIVC